jgi:hypothetical protein
MVREQRTILRNFYQSARWRKKKKGKVYDRVASYVRRLLREAGGPSDISLLFIGMQGTCINSRLGGDFRTGGKWLRQKHMEYTTVVLTDEFGTSKTFLYCHEPVTRPIVKKLVHGKVMKVESQGFSICYNHYCPLYFAKATTENQNALAAGCICLADTSEMLMARD